jgi:hypothetical protein
MFVRERIDMGHDGLGVVGEDSGRFDRPSRFLYLLR